MTKLIFLPAVAVSLAALYLFSKNRHIKFDFEGEFEPREPNAADGTMMEAGIE